MISILVGNNVFELNRALRRLINAFVDKNGNLALEQFDAEEDEPAKIVGAIEATPFLASEKMVVIRGLSLAKNLADDLVELLERVPKQTHLVIVEPKPDKRSKFYLTLKKQPEFKEFNELDRPSLSRWAGAYTKEHGGQIGYSEVNLLIDRIGANQMRLAHEIEKLVAYNPKIERQAIEMLTEETPQSTIFNLLDAAFAGNKEKALKIYEQQRQLKVEPQQIISMMAWQLHILALAKTAGGASADKIAKEAEVSAYTVQKAQNLATHFSLKQIKEIVKKLIKIEIDSKTKSISTDDAVKNLLLTLGEQK